MAPSDHFRPIGFSTRLDRSRLRLVGIDLTGGGGVMTAQPHGAIESGDDLVQLLTIVKYALEAGDTAQAMRSLDAAIATARRTMTELSDAVIAVEGNQTILGLALRSRPAPAPPTS
jgi:hypothetical protein